MRDLTPSKSMTSLKREQMITPTAQWLTALRRTTSTQRSHKVPFSTKLMPLEILKKVDMTERSKQVFIVCRRIKS